MPTRHGGLKERQHITPLQLTADDHLARGINAMHLKYRLRNIETDRANLAHGRLPSMWFASRNHPMALLMPQSGRRPQLSDYTDYLRFSSSTAGVWWARVM
jgi:hypothetical protein